MKPMHLFKFENDIRKRTWFLYCLFLILLLLLKYSWFTMLCQPLLYLKVTLLYTYRHSFLYILFHYGLSQDTAYSSLSYTVGPCCLSILHIIVSIPKLPVYSVLNLMLVQLRQNSCTEVHCSHFIFPGFDLEKSQWDEGSQSSTLPLSSDWSLYKSSVVRIIALNSNNI